LESSRLIDRYEGGMTKESCVIIKSISFSEIINLFHQQAKMIDVAYD
jgi:hypothetical protein